MNNAPWLCPSVKQEHRTAFFGEDIYIDFPKGTVGEVVFQPKNNQSVEVVLVREGQKVDSRVTINSLGHLVLEDVQKKDEGAYVVRNSSNPGAAKQLILHVQGNASLLTPCCFCHGNNRFKIQRWISHKSRYMAVKCGCGRSRRD